MLPFPEPLLRGKSSEYGLDICSKEFALKLDEDDELRHFREQFCFPKMKDLAKCQNTDTKCIYLCGNSLGLKPKIADEYMKKCLDDWGNLGVHSHFVGFLPAAACDLPLMNETARLVGAQPEEVTLMNGLSVNIHLLLVHFYRPTKERNIILMVDSGFPSDRYAVRSQIGFHGYDPEISLLTVGPPKGQHLLQEEDLLKTIEENGSKIALVFLEGVHYYTGQKMNIPEITKAAHKQGCIVGFDLAHAIGNVKLDLHNQGVDFACWCSYKYLNSGAGGMGAIFVHDKQRQRKEPKLHGWWSNKEHTRFEMKDDIDESEGALGFRISNPPPWLATLNKASLDIFSQTTMDQLVSKQLLLTGYLELLLNHYFATSSGVRIEIVTPRDPNQRGCQLSLIFFNVNLEKVHEKLESRGIMCDIRKPNVMRIAPVPLYNSFEDVFEFIRILREVAAEEEYQ